MVSLCSGRRMDGAGPVTDQAAAARGGPGCGMNVGLHPGIIEMPDTRPCPLSARQIVELYFMEHRAKLLDIAAFLDRLDRAKASGEAQDALQADDVRVRALRQAIGLVLDGEPDRVRRILELLSDHSRDPIPAAHTQSALGADPLGTYG
jgi:hypothetical protein